MFSTSVTDTNVNIQNYEVNIKSQAEADEDKVLIFLAICFSPLLLAIIIYYIWNYMKAWRVGPITWYPIIPFHTGYMRRKDHANNRIQFLLGSGGIEFKFNTERLRAKLMKILKIDNIPTDAEVISVKMEGFDFGSNCHKFEPMDGMGPESYCTYQMFGDNQIQVTNYVEDGVSYVAGFVIYIKNEDHHPVNVRCYRLSVIKRYMSSPKYKCTRPIVDRTSIRAEEPPKRIENEVARTETRTPSILLDGFKTGDWNVKICGELQRDVMTAVRDGSVYHKEWNSYLQKLKVHKCDACSEDLNQDPPPPSYASVCIVQPKHIP